MLYTIKECSEKTKLTAYTLRYYEREGLILNIQRTSTGQRMYSDEDIELIKSIDCLKKAGMSIKKIKSYMDIFKNDDNSDARVALFKQQKQVLENKMKELEKEMYWADYKIWYYQNIDKYVDKNDPLHCEKMETIYQEIFNKSIPD